MRARRFLPFIAALTACSFFPSWNIASALTAGRVTIGGVEYEVTRRFAWVNLHRVGAPRSYAPIPMLSAARMHAAATAVMPELEAYLGLERAGLRLEIDSLRSNDELGCALGYRPARDGVFWMPGSATILFDPDGRVFRIEAAVGGVLGLPDVPAPRWMSRGEALALAIRMAGAPWDSTVYVNRRILSIDDTSGVSAMHEVVIGCTVRGRPDACQVLFTPEGRILYSRSMTKYD